MNGTDNGHTVQSRPAERNNRTPTAVRSCGRPAVMGHRLAIHFF